MTVSSVSDATLLQPDNAVGKKDLDQADFLELFIAELQYQDPMDPMDNYEMASQLAQFSTMDSAAQMNANMEKLLDYQTSQNNLQLLTLLDSEVQVNGNMMGVVDGKATSTEFDLENAAETIKVEIFDAGGHLVWQNVRGREGAGTYQLEWDGIDTAGNTVDDGAYQYVVTAMDAVGTEVGVAYRSTGKVTGVSFEGGGAVLTMDEYVTASAADVIKVQSSSSSGSPVEPESEPDPEPDPEPEAEIVP